MWQDNLLDYQPLYITSFVRPTENAIPWAALLTIQAAQRAFDYRRLQRMVEGGVDAVDGGGGQPTALTWTWMYSATLF